MLLLLKIGRAGKSLIKGVVIWRCEVQLARSAVDFDQGRSRVLLLLIWPANLLLATLSPPVLKVAV